MTDADVPLDLVLHTPGGLVLAAQRPPKLIWPAILTAVNAPPLLAVIKSGINDQHCRASREPGLAINAYRPDNHHGVQRPI
jgi:hypothetical protein